jgi:hypothetical protein
MGHILAVGPSYYCVPDFRSERRSFSILCCYKSSADKDRCICPFCVRYLPVSAGDRVYSPGTITYQWVRITSYILCVPYFTSKCRIYFSYFCHILPASAHYILYPFFTVSYPCMRNIAFLILRHTLPVTADYLSYSFVTRNYLLSDDCFMHRSCAICCQWMQINSFLPVCHILSASSDYLHIPDHQQKLLISIPVCKMEHCIIRVLSAKL